MKHFIITIIAIVSLVSCGGAEERKAVYLEKAQQSLDVGNLDKARINLRNVLQIDPKDAQAYFQLGEIFNQKSEYQKAFNNYSKAVEYDPENFEYHAKIGTYFLILAGDVESAIEKRDFILDKEPSNIDGLLLKAGILLKQNDIAAAKKITQDIFLRRPEQVQNAMLLSSIHQRSKEYVESINVLNACIKHNPRNSMIRNMLANTYLMTEDLEQAENEYIAILDQDPDVFSNYLKLAMFYRQIDKTDKAELILRNAIKKDKKDLERKLVLVDFIRQTKGAQLAIDELKTLVDSDPELGELQLELGKLYIAENKLDDAEKLFKSVVSDFSNASIGIKSRLYIAHIYMQNKNIGAATSIIDEALSVSPNDSEVNFVKAKLQLENKNHEGAIASFRIVVKENPENVEAYLLLSAAHRASGDLDSAQEIVKQAYDKNRANKDGLLLLARYQARNKNHDELKKIVDNYLSIDANNYEILSYKTGLLNESKMFSEARTYASRIIELYPDMPKGYLHTAIALRSENKKSEAIALLEEGYVKTKKNARILELMVSIYVDLKDFDSAVNKILSALHEGGETAELYMFLATIQWSSGNRESAISSLLKATDINPEWNQPYLNLAEMYMADKQNEKAIEILQKGLTKKNDLKLILALTRIYEGIGDFNAAINEYENAYEKNNNQVVLANNLASLLSEYRKDENSLKRAKELADKLKDIDQVVIRDTVGWVYYKVGAYTEAVNVLKTVVKKSPELALFNYHLGMALYKTGDQEAARIYLTNALADNSDFPGKDDAEAQLKKLQ